MLASRSASALLSALPPPSRSFGPLNRRRAVRRRWSGTTAAVTSQVFANKYIDGFPYAVEVLDASATGLSIRPIAEPATDDRDGFTLELFVDDRSIFTWARRVRRSADGQDEGYRILAVDSLDRARFEKFLRTLPT